MKKEYYLFDKPVSVQELGIWTKVTGSYDQVFGYTFFGDYFLHSTQTDQCAILYTMPPELAELEFYGIGIFIEEFLTNDIVREELLQRDKIEKLENKLGSLESNEVYIPEPYPFLGGDCSIESYDKGNVWVFAKLVGESQLDENKKGSD